MESHEKALSWDGRWNQDTFEGNAWLSFLASLETVAFAQCQCSGWDAVGSPDDDADNVQRMRAPCGG